MEIKVSASSAWTIFYAILKKKKENYLCERFRSRK